MDNRKAKDSVDLLDIIEDVAMGNKAEVERMVISPALGDVIDVYVECVKRGINPEDLSWGPLGKTWSHVLSKPAKETTPSDN